MRRPRSPAPIMNLGSLSAACRAPGVMISAILGAAIKPVGRHRAGPYRVGHVVTPVVAAPATLRRRPSARLPRCPHADDRLTMDLQQIGLQHPRIRQLRHVLNNSSPSLRRFVVAEGLWAHDVLLELGTPIEVFLWCPEAASTPQARARSEQIAARAEHAYRISPKVLERLAERDRPDGLVSLVGLPRWDPAALTFGRPALVLVADGIEIPGNLGAMVRTLDACGGDCLILTNRRTRLSHPTVFRGSRGMVLRVPVVDLDGPAQAAAWLHERGFTIYLATPGPGAIAYPQVAFTERTAFVVGNERYGIAADWFDLGLTRITVPMLGVADSLNVSVSASILLYAVRAPAAGWPSMSAPS